MLDFSGLLLEKGMLPKRSRSSLLVDTVFPLYYQDFVDDYFSPQQLSYVWSTLLPAWTLYVNITNTNVDALRRRHSLWDA